MIMSQHADLKVRSLMQQAVTFDHDLSYLEDFFLFLRMIKREQQ